MQYAVTQAAVAFPGCHLHSQVLWTLQENQMCAGRCCCRQLAQPEGVLVLILSDLLCGRSSVLQKGHCHDQ